MGKRSAISAAIVLGTLGFAASLLARKFSLAQNFDGRKMFVNTEPVVKEKLSASGRGAITFPRSKLSSGASTKR